MQHGGMQGGGMQGGPMNGGMDNGGGGALAAVMEAVRSNPVLLQAVGSNQFLQHAIKQHLHNGVPPERVLHMLQEEVMMSGGMNPGMGGNQMGGNQMGGNPAMGNMGGGNCNPNMMGGAQMGGGDGVMGGGGGGGGGGGMEPLSRAVFFKHLPPGTTHEDVVNEVGAYGPLESVRLNAEKGEALVAFLDAYAAGNLLQVTVPPPPPS